MHLFGIQFEGVFGEFETFLHEGSEFTDATALFTKDLLSVCGTDDDLEHGRLRVGTRTCVECMYLRASMGYTNVTARVALFCEFAGEEFVEFGAEDTVCDKLALFADLGGHLGVIGWAVNTASTHLDHQTVIQLLGWSADVSLTRSCNARHP